jgi:hypothetical protein
MDSTKVQIEHGIACITKMREIAAKGALQDDAEVMQGLFRKIEQIAGYGLQNMGAAEKPQGTFQERAEAATKAKIRELTHA